MPDILNRITTIYRAETAGAEAAVKRYRGTERDEAKKVLDGLNAHNAGLRDQIATIGKVAAAIGGLVALYKGAQIAAAAYLEDVRLESAAAGASVAGLRKATLGLVETDHLLAFAGKAMHGTWKLNQAEMERVLRGATALRKTMGVELQPTIEKLTESIAKGNTRALKEFGIEAKDKEGVLRELDALFSGLGGKVAIAGDEFSKTGVEMADAFDNVQGELGKLVVQLQPAIQALATFVGWLAKGVGFAGKFTDALIGVDTQGGSNLDQRRREIEDLRSRAAGLRVRHGRFNGDNDIRADDLERQADQLQHVLDIKAAQALGRDLPAAAIKSGALMAEAFKRMLLSGRSSPAKVKGGKKGGSGATGSFDMDALAGIGDAASAFGGVPGSLLASGQAAFAGWQNDAQWGAIGADVVGGQNARGAIGGSIAEGSAAIESMLAQFAAFQEQRDSQRSLLTQLFGTPAEISELTGLLEIAAGSFNTITDAAVAAFDAWITGSKSIGAAFKEAIADGLRANATQMLGESIKHAAFALGSLAFFDYSSAAKHGAAALKFAGGAAAMGVLAQQMGKATGQWAQGGGASAGAGGGSTPRTVGNGASSSQSNAPITIYVGAEWAGMSAMEQSGAIVRAINLGNRGSQHIRRH